MELWETEVYGKWEEEKEGFRIVGNGNGEEKGVFGRMI